MALIRSFERKELERYQLHDEVEAHYYLYETDGRRLFQINTFGRADRANPGKLSQSIQLDENSASELFHALKTHFGFK